MMEKNAQTSSGPPRFKRKVSRQKSSWILQSRRLALNNGPPDVETSLERFGEERTKATKDSTEAKQAADMASCEVATLGTKEIGGGDGFPDFRARSDCASSCRLQVGAALMTSLSLTESTRENCP
jgi:hypothetical protein